MSSQKTKKNIKYLLRQKYFFQNLKPIPILEVEILLSLSLLKTREFLYSHPEYEPTKQELSKFERLISRRTNHEPIAYITGTKEFFGYDFKVNKHVLIPRPETEELVTETLKQTKNKEKKKIKIIEIGTGSGCISIALALEFEKLLSDKTLSIKAIDVSTKALDVAKLNLNSYQDRINPNSIIFEQLDILDQAAVKDTLKSEVFDIVVSNPPYIKTQDIQDLSEDIKNYEPHLALDGGTDGQMFYKVIKKNLENNLADNAVFVFEGMEGEVVGFLKN